jgi:hypothetical protein
MALAHGLQAGFVLLDCGPFFGAVTGKHLLVGFGQ